MKGRLCDKPCCAMHSRKPAERLEGESKAMPGLLIGEVAKQMGLRTSAIRYYESEGLLPKPDRRSGQRIYDASILDRLSLIELAKAAGFSIADIRQLFQAVSRKTPPGPRWRALAARKAEELEETITRAQRMKQVLAMVMKCECPTFQDCAQASRCEDSKQSGQGSHKESRQESR